MERVLQPAGRAIIVLVGQLTGGGMLPALIRRLYQLSGQRDEFLNQGAISDLIPAGAFEVKSEIVALEDSAVQLLVLSKAATIAESGPENSLDAVNTL